jgi:hypothetical protein
MRGNLEKRGGPAPFRSAVLAFLLIGGLLLLMLFCGWLYAGTSGAVIASVLGAIALMLVRKVSPQFFLLLSGARSIDPKDLSLPARRHCPGSEPLFPSIRCSEGFCHRRWRSIRHRCQLRAAAPSHDPRADRRARA